MQVFIFHHDRTIVLFLCLNTCLRTNRKKLQAIWKKANILRVRIKVQVIWYYDYLFNQQKIKYAEKNKNETPRICGAVVRRMSVACVFDASNLEFGKISFSLFSADVFHLPSAPCLFLASKWKSGPCSHAIADPSRWMSLLSPPASVRNWPH